VGFGLSSWSVVFPDFVGIRRALRVVSRMLDGRAVNFGGVCVVSAFFDL
jgi:hypothetical protein